MHPRRGRDSTCVPLKWLAIWTSDRAAMIWMSGLAHAASEPQAAGQIKPSSRAIGADRGGKHAGYRRDRAVETELAENGKPVSNPAVSRRSPPSARARSAGRTWLFLGGRQARD